MSPVNSVEITDTDNRRNRVTGIGHRGYDSHQVEFSTSIERYNRIMDGESTGDRFERLVEIMARLRGPNGCPWDKEQNFDTLKPMLVEEVYEVLEAVDNKDWDGVSEELGDLLLHIVFQAQLGKENRTFDINTVIQKICDKNWEAIKAQEKAEKLGRRTPEQRSVLEGIPSKLPAIHEAHQISDRVARVGFDWPDIEGIFDKLQEEIAELKAVIGENNHEFKRDRLEDEIGDLLFVIVNIARYLKIDSESALKRANRKFKSRFQYMETELARQGRSVEDTNMDEMEALWQRAKTENLTP